MVALLICQVCMQDLIARFPRGLSQSIDKWWSQCRIGLCGEVIVYLLFCLASNVFIVFLHKFIVITVHKGCQHLVHTAVPREFALRFSCISHSLLLSLSSPVPHSVNPCTTSFTRFLLSLRQVPSTMDEYFKGQIHKFTKSQMC